METPDLDTMKFSIDIGKHMATLSTGTILVLVAVAEKLVKQVNSIYLIIGFVLLIFSLIFSCFTILAAYPPFNKRTTKWNIVADFAFYCLGVVFILFFFLYSLG